MKQIKFSHSYFKLWMVLKSQPVVLLQVFSIDVAALSQAFLRYDTEYPIKSRIERYPLPKKGKVLVLLFKDINGELFTTVRRWTLRKIEYYNKSVGEEFKIVFTSDEQPGKASD